MLLDLIQSGFSKDAIIQLLVCIPIILFSLTIHEYAHGYAALKCGDHTAESLGRLDLNPLKHLDPIGTLCMLVCGIGWAKPVPINSRYFKNPRRDTAITAAAGPLTNLVAGFLFAVLMKITMLIAAEEVNTAYLYLNGYDALVPGTLAYIAYAFYLLFYVGMQMNVYLAIFNLLPIPPFDGSRIFFIFLPTKYYFGIMKYERIIKIVILVLLWTGALSSTFGKLTNAICNGFLSLLGM